MHWPRRWHLNLFTHVTWSFHFKMAGSCYCLHFFNISYRCVITILLSNNKKWTDKSWIKTCIGNRQQLGEFSLLLHELADEFRLFDHMRMDIKASGRIIRTNRARNCPKSTRPVIFWFPFVYHRANPTNLSKTFSDTSVTSFWPESREIARTSQNFRSPD